MTVLSYIHTGFTAAEQAVLQKWYDAFNVDDAWRLIRRNFDRECDRSDVDPARLADYLRDIALHFDPSAADAPLAVMDHVYSARKSYFLLPGQPLAPINQNVARVVRADHLLKYNLHSAGIPVTMGLSALINAVKTKAINGSDLDGSRMGRADHPVWVCPADQRPVLSADDCRDQLGLHHIDHGHMVAIDYPEAILTAPFELRAPTTIDSATSGADNWIFSKRPKPGGPEWGHAVNLVGSKAGVDEAVHRDFPIDTSKAALMTLSYVGQISASPPAVDYATLWVNL